MNAGKRNEVWDIVKGLGIIFVVAGHGFQGEISKFVNLFHIPLFFFASGLVFKFADRSFKSVVVFIFKCLKTLWLPSVLYGTFYVLMHNPFVSIGLYDLDRYSLRQIGSSIVKHIGFMKTEPLESAMWFLTAIFIGKFLLYGVLWISSFFDNDKKKQKMIEFGLVASFFLLGCFFSYKNINLPGNADIACSLVLFMYAGYKMKRMNLECHWLAIPSLIVMILLLIISGRTLRMSRNELVDPLFFLVTSAAGICFTFQLASVLKNWNPSLITLSYLGRQTIPILCLHLFAFRFVSFAWIVSAGLPMDMLSKHPVIDSSLFWGIFYTILGLVAPLIVSVVSNRIRIVGRT